MAQRHLNDWTVRGLRSDAAQTDYYCASTPRFGVRVSKGGRKTFFISEAGERSGVDIASDSSAEKPG